MNMRSLISRHNTTQDCIISNKSTYREIERCICCHFKLAHTFSYYITCVCVCAFYCKKMQEMRIKNEEILKRFQVFHTFLKINFVLKSSFKKILNMDFLIKEVENDKQSYSVPDFKPKQNVTHAVSFRKRLILACNEF